MQTILFYFLQVILCSAIMMAYYGLVLRNKRFHTYNRFYLLSAAVLPWLIPLLKININQPAPDTVLPVQVFAVIASSNAQFEEAMVKHDLQLTWQAGLATVYLTVAALLLLSFFVSLLKIYKLLRTHSCKKHNDVYLVLTKADGAPFSFFKFIFWHTDIDATTPAGRQVLQHELAHVKEKHSADKILVQLVLIAGWYNPVFWLVKRELNMVHEFTADNVAIADGDTASLAGMLLAAAYPKHRFSLSNPFFYSPIKRRLIMLTNNRHPRFSYVRRVLILPLLAMVTLLIAFRKKESTPATISLATAVEKVTGSVVSLIEKPAANETQTVSKAVRLSKTYTVMIDAGHGGADGGASGIDGVTKESELALQLAKLVRDNNSNANIRIILSRETDVYIHPSDRVLLAKEKKPDLFISLHCNAADLVKKTNDGRESPTKGIELVLSKSEVNDTEKMRLYNTIASGLSRLDKTIRMQYRTSGIYVVNHNFCPAVLVECGYMTNTDDLKKLKNASYQKQFANGILAGIETYFSNEENGNNAITKILSDTAIKVVRSYKEAMNKGFAVTKTDTEGKFITPLSQQSEATNASPLVFINGERSDYSKIEHIEHSQILSVSVIKGADAIRKYGSEGKNGVIEITLKNTSLNNLLNNLNSYFDRLTGKKPAVGGC